MRDAIIRTANAIRNQRYSDAVTTFAVGSLVRGDGTAFSDLDLVVVYESVPNAYRESFRFGGFPVEAFVHDITSSSKSTDHQAFPRFLKW